VIPLLEKVNRDGRLNGRIEINGTKQKGLLESVADIFASTNDIINWVSNKYPQSTIKCALIWDESYTGDESSWNEICILLKDGKFGKTSLTDPSIRQVIEQYIIDHLRDTSKTYHHDYHSSP
jgi:hypothetical protein